MHLAWSGPRPNSHDMTCVLSPFCTQDSADAQIEAAVLRLVELLGRQTARDENGSAKVCHGSGGIILLRAE